MSLILTLIAAALVSALLFVPAVRGTPQEGYLGIAALVVLGLAVIAEIVGMARRRGRRAERKAPEPTEPLRAPGAREADVEAGVVQFLGRLQEKGRLVDFAMDDIASYGDAAIAAAARVVHQGCREVLQDHFEIQPVHPGEEQERVSLSEDYDARAYRLIGKVPDAPPYEGTVLHRGWKTVKIALPRRTGDADDPGAREVIAPAEVEIG